MINVFCVYVGDAYIIDYVQNLKHGVDKHLSEEHTFNIFTDRRDQHKELEDLGIVRYVPDFGSIKKWWYKMFMFNKELNITGPVLYLDLDVIVVGNLDPLVTKDNKFRIIHDFNRSNVGMHYAKSNSSAMSWVFEQHTHLWERFKIDIPKHTSRMAGDQDFIHLNVMNKEWWPSNWIVSYKWEYKRNKLYAVDQTKVLVFHGKPKPHEIEDIALQEIWRYNK
jgi:hypothetical protein